MRTDLEVKQMIIDLVNSDRGLSKTQIVNIICRYENLSKRQVWDVYYQVKEGLL